MAGGLFSEVKARTVAHFIMSSALYRRVIWFSESLLFPKLRSGTVSALGDQITGVLCLAALLVHFLMLVSELSTQTRSPWEGIFFILTTLLYFLWRFLRNDVNAHIRLSRRIITILASFVIARWFYAWAALNPNLIYFSIVSGLLYMPLLLICLTLLGCRRHHTLVLIGSFTLAPALFHTRDVLLGTPYSEWRMAPAIAGAYLVFDYILRSLVELENRILVLSEETEKLQISSTIDPLTQALNRRGFQEKRSLSTRTRSGVVIIDIDHFKSINDRFGHLVGDSVLAKVASLIKGLLRNDDIVCRWGGEEFLVILDGVAEQRAGDLAQKIIDEIAFYNWERIHEGLNRVTASAGVTTSQSGVNFQEFLHQADQALLRAKSMGRNRVEVSSQSS